MNQCVPRWDLDDSNEPPLPSKFSFRSHSNATAQDAPMVDDYEVAELTWENGQIALHALGPPRMPPAKPIALESLSTKHTWEKTQTCGTLESIVDQATCLPLHQEPPPQVNDELVPWFDPRHEANVSMNMDALVPASNRTKQDRNSTAPVMDSVPGLCGTRGVGGSTHVGSCSDPHATQDVDVLLTAGKRSRAAPSVPVAPEWSGRDPSASHSATFGPASHLHHMAMDARERGMIAAAGLTPTTSFCSHENTTSSGKPRTHAIPVSDENDSKTVDEEEIKRKEKGKSSVSTKRSRAAAIHNRSERKRRDKINQRMKTLQKMVPNSSKTDKASMLDEVIEYLKQLQAQVQLMNRMNMQPMMMPMAMQQQQLQMAMMAPMGMGMGMGVMDMNSMGRPNISAMPTPILHPAAFMPIASWDHGSIHDPHQRFPAASTTAMPDPLSAYLAFQHQPMTVEAYSRMAAALYQQLQQQPQASNSKS